MSQVCLHGGQVLSLNAQHAVYNPGVVIFEHGCISFAGDQNEAPLPAADATLLDCSERIVMPGLINTHTHTGMSYFRNLLEDLSSADWFRYEMLAERDLSADDAYWAALLGAYELLRQGVTTTADRFSHMDRVIRALQHAGIRAIAAPSLVDRDAAQRQRQTLDLLEQYGSHGDGLIRVGLGPVGPDTCSTELLQWTRAQADRHDALIFIHLAQSRQELAEIARRGYASPVQYLEQIGVLGSDLVAAHCMYLDDAGTDIELLARRGVSVAHCPASNAKIEGRVAPIMALQSAGVRIGLGTDCAASNNTMDMFSEMRSAGLLHKVATQEPTAMPLRELLEMATRGAAQCLRLDDRIGSLEAGKRADIITVSCQQPWLQPWHDPYAGLVYATRGLDVQEVWVDGQQRVAAGKLLADDVADVVARAVAWAERYPEVRMPASLRR